MSRMFQGIASLSNRRLGGVRTIEKYNIPPFKLDSMRFLQDGIRMLGPAELSVSHIFGICLLIRIRHIQILQRFPSYGLNLSEW